MRQRFAFYGTDYDQLYNILPFYDGGGLESSPYDWVAHQIAIEDYENSNSEDQKQERLPDEEDSA